MPFTVTATAELAKVNSAKNPRSGHGDHCDEAQCDDLCQYLNELPARAVDGAEQRTFGLGLCASGKYRYDTRPAADRGERAFHRNVRKRCTVYRCSECHGYHLGSSFSRGRRR